MQHGACLGLGLAALGTCDPEIFEEVKSIVFQDSAIAGEGAGIGVGLLFAGTATDFAEELLMMTRETQHEKVCKVQSPLRSTMHWISDQQRRNTMLPLSFEMWFLRCAEPYQAPRLC